MIVTTTNIIEGSEISRYNYPMAANFVIGTTVSRDIGTSYVAFCGGFEEKTLKPEMVHDMFNRRAQIVEGTNGI
ncbi:heavy metal-binding domain-containing protein [Sphingobacterium sp.]|uniref:heavy metal-binding domain-containing protein n=1 Tax=Sphingobacterium sp. TaxID=341027 RepID=UPI00289BA705|nr:heavy metal-binding domain-containing protein [Sphingobacterium sp.]